jgi:hypothetical protein
MNVIEPMLNVWVGMWREALPGFRTDSLYPAGITRAFGSVYTQPAQDFISERGLNDVIEVLGERSPYGRFHLVFDRYQAITEENGEIEIGGDPDSAPVLLDLRHGTASVFESCGTPCGFHYGVWISPTRFALGGWQEVDPAGTRKQGRLWVYSIEDSVTTQYVTRAIPARDFDRYLSAWTDWVSARYRARRGREGGSAKRSLAP